MKRVLIAVVLFTGCKEPEPVAWVEGFGYGWTGFNHRLSHVEYAIDGEDAVVAVVGGTSTSGVDPVLPVSCDPDTCAELPFTDSSDVSVRWVRATLPHEVVGHMWVDVVAPGDTTVVIPLARRAPAGWGDVFVVIGGFELDTDVPLPTDSCYDPAYGWMPKSLGVDIGERALTDDRKGVEVSVSGVFEAGLSLEPERACIDAVAAEARVSMRVELIAVVGDFHVTDHVPVDQSASYAWGCSGSGPCLEPDPQPDPAPEPVGVLDDEIAGWDNVHFTFMDEDTAGRGAYLRTLSYGFDYDAGEAWGRATSYSPVTQLSGFDYTFTGELFFLGLLDGDIERGEVTGNVFADLDATGDAVPHRLPL